jgi:hypothetical protein
MSRVPACHAPAHASLPRAASSRLLHWSRVTSESHILARRPLKGGANGGAGERGRDGARSPAPGAGAMPGRRRHGPGRDAVFGDRTRAVHPPPSARFGPRNRTVAEEQTRATVPTPCTRGRLRGIESGGIPGSCHDEGRAREAIFSSADLATDAVRARYRHPVPDSP